MKFAIVDIETTGSHARGHGITEVAVVITDGERILDEWESLVDPGIPIPEHITRLTGIDDDLVADAPPFAAIADELEGLLADCIFVAHNVGFDFAFIRGHFEEMGREWSRPKLCTVRLSRKLLPNVGSFSLGSVCERLGISNAARHRAMGDAFATAQLFHHLWSLPHGPTTIEAALKKGTRESWLPQHVPASDFDNLPQGPGVYRMLDARGIPLYIGMSHQVQTRIRSHFTGKLASARRQALLRDVHRIVAEPTGSTLYARILEDVLIRTHWPIHNRAQKHQPMLHLVLPYRDRQGYDRLMIQRARSTRGSIAHFGGVVEAREWLFGLANDHNLDPALLGLGATSDAPSHAPDEHNERLQAGLKERLHPAFPTHAFCLVQGRTDEEAGVLYVRESRFAGLGWLEGGLHPTTDLDQLLDAVSDSARSGLTDAVLREAFLQPESVGERVVWRCFDESGNPADCT